MEQIDLDLEEFEDEFIKEYRNKRIEEMRRAMAAVYVDIVAIGLRWKAFITLLLGANVVTSVVSEPVL